MFAVASPAFRGIKPWLRWLGAVCILAFFALASLGFSARINGEVSAALQSPTTRTLALVMLATPIVMAASRSSAQTGDI